MLTNTGLSRSPESDSRADLPDVASKIVVTSDEVTRETPNRTTSFEVPVHPVKTRLSPWLMCVTSALALCLPLLCFWSIGVRLAVRHRPASVRQSWDHLLCTLLISSGLLTSIAFSYLLALSLNRSSVSQRPAVSLGLLSLQKIQSFPHFPTPGPLNAEQIATKCKPLVFILVPDPGFAPSRDYLSFAPLGAATLLMADTGGYLFCTSRHVLEEKSFSIVPRNDRFLIFSHEGDYAPVEIVGRNRDLDLAILWEPSIGPHARFSQSIAISRAIHTGEQVFVIGHPQRLFYTLSSGLISREEDPRVLQFSAPVSPGNSGGPVYDSFGNLLGIVQSTVDRTNNPNAENLNFAVRSDTLLSDNQWDFTGSGSKELNRFRQTQSR